MVEETMKGMKKKVTKPKKKNLKQIQMDMILVVEFGFLIVKSLRKDGKETPLQEI